MIPPKINKMDKIYKRSGLIVIMAFIFQSIVAQIPPKDHQIKAAVQAVPEEMREGATVLGYNDDGELVTLREGTNGMICLTDDPNRKGFNAACYHQDLEPFMARGRELRAEGVSRNQVFETREKEVKSGKLKMPNIPATLHILYGNDAKYDPETEKVTDASIRYVIYIPYATSESTGLPTSPPFPGAPWIMNPGTHTAHIMVTPPKK